MIKLYSNNNYGFCFFFPKSLAGEYKKMVMEEIYLLTKHANFDSDYIEKVPVFKRRFYLNMLKEELEDTKKAQEKAQARAKSNAGRKG